MNPIETMSKIEICEINGAETPVRDKEYFSIKSHWSNPYKVCLKFGEREITLIAADLIEAINRCSK